VGGGPFGLRPGEWTDDTSMALCLAESLIERNGFDPADQMGRYRRWWREGHLSSNGRCFDIGVTVSGALRRFEQTGEPFCGSTDPSTAGNGSLMRLAPVPLFYSGNPRLAVEMAAESSRTTHGADEAVAGCRYLAALIVGALGGASKEELLSDHFEPAEGLWAGNQLAPNIAEVASGSFKRREPPEIKGSGYVVRSLEAALWAFAGSNDFREGALLAVNLGDDADTTGAVYGQLAGTYYGERGIPGEWRALVAKREMIVSMADRLLRSRGGNLTRDEGSERELKVKLHAASGREGRGRLTEADGFEVADGDAEVGAVEEVEDFRAED
jgi:ADP-ribosyl-[dinitrogen reductase] hydrolase